MLSTNIWIHVGLVNEALLEVFDIAYKTSFRPLDVLMYVVARINIAIGHHGTKMTQICTDSSYILGKLMKIPLTIPWAIAIHKSQGMTPKKVTIDIGRIER